MVKPKKLKVGYKSYNIKYGHGIMHGDEECDGLIDLNKGSIDINEDLQSGDLKRVLLHEIVHALEFIYNFEFTEQQVNQIATSLLIFMLDNKDFIKDILIEEKE